MAELTENMVVLLSALANKDCRKLCHTVVDSLCGREPPHRGDYSATWSLQEWLQLLDSLTALFRLAVVNNISDEVVLSQLSDVSSSQAEVVLSVLRAREEEIRCALLDRTDSISSATLQDFDWQLKLALSSDKISSLHTPLLSLSLDVRENGVVRPVTVEMNRDELGMLISSLESANKDDGARLELEDPAHVTDFLKKTTDKSLKHLTQSIEKKREVVICCLISCLGERQEDLFHDCQECEDYTDNMMKVIVIHNITAEEDPSDVSVVIEGNQVMEGRGQRHVYC